MPVDAILYVLSGNMNMAGRLISRHQKLVHISTGTSILRYISHWPRQQHKGFATTCLLLQFFVFSSS